MIDKVTLGVNTFLLISIRFQLLLPYEIYTIEYTMGKNILKASQYPTSLVSQ